MTDITRKLFFSLCFSSNWIRLHSPLSRRMTICYVPHLIYIASPKPIICSPDCLAVCFVRRKETETSVLPAPRYCRCPGPLYLPNNNSTVENQQKRTNYSCVQTGGDCLQTMCDTSPGESWLCENNKKYTHGWYRGWRSWKLELPNCCWMLGRWKRCSGGSFAVGLGKTRCALFFRRCVRKSRRGGHSLATKSP